MLNTLKIVIMMFFMSYNVCAQFHAIHIPIEKLDKMKMDGDTLDWQWVPDEYHIYTNNMIDVENNTKCDKSNWSCKITVGWNETKNWLYILAIVKDNIKSVDRDSPSGEFYLDDCMEVAINPDNIGGEYSSWSKLPRSFCTIKFDYSFPLIDENIELGLRNGPLWYLDKKYIDWGGRDYLTSDNHIVSVYEVCTSLWDYWSEDGIVYSKKSQLYFNKKIGLSIAFDDIDNKDVRIAQWATSSGKNWYRNADELSEFTLDGKIFENCSWQNIFYLLKPE